MNPADDAPSTRERLRYDRIECVPIIHGRLAFALEVRRRLLAKSYSAVAVELPPALAPAVAEGIRLLPTVTVALYREIPSFIDADAPAFYVPIQPADGIVEALRIAERERIPAVYVDAELSDLDEKAHCFPDPLGLRTLGLEKYYRLCVHLRGTRTGETAVRREKHMAARLRGLLDETSGPILFVCGLAHWLAIRALLEHREDELCPDEMIPAESIQHLVPDARSVPFVLGEMPYTVVEYETHRSGWELEEFDAVESLKGLLLTARDHHQANYPGSLERPDPQSLRVVLDFARRLTVRKGQLIPDSYTLTVAANAVVGNDYALSVLATAHAYPWNGALFDESPEEEPNPEASTGETAEAGSCPWGEPKSDEPETWGAGEEGCGDGGLRPISMTDSRGSLDGQDVELRNRCPGSAFTYGSLQLEQPPDIRRQREWSTHWDESVQCSWPPEDIVIENFRDYVGKRALSLARVAQSRTEPFAGSFLDGIDIRETMRDVVKKRIHVREEPRVPGGVGALVLIFEEDDFGERYPWRTTWMAEHRNESTLGFYATDYRENVIGPGVARAHYGGCMLVFPPILIPDLWNDLRFERARTPSERLLLAAMYWSREHYLVHVAQRPASEGVRAEARRRGKHIVHLPLSTFSSRTLERLRRVHVLNGHQVRSWANRFIR